MRAYIVKCLNMIHSGSDDLAFNNNEKEYIATTEEDKPVIAAFDNLNDAMNGVYSVLNDLIGEFEEFDYFKEKQSRISLNVDVVEISVDDFNEIRLNNPTTGRFAILSIPHELEK
jgi:hypothetical protein